MRLTLRTLLAYLDDILEPQDAAEISRKIEESKFATDLIHRIRNSTRRLRLGAPPVDAKGIGLDANTVSEYLDNIKKMRPEQIADFEKVCLESDVHLAEVASCHQILALVLGQPAEVDDDMRARMYRLGTGELPAEQAAPPAAPSPEPSAVPAPLLLDTEDRRESPLTAPRATLSGGAKPDYRQVGKKVPVQSLAITLVCGFLLAVVALRAMGPFGSAHPVWRLLSGRGEAVVAEQTDRGERPESPTAESGVSPSRDEEAGEKPIVEPSESTPVPPTVDETGTPTARSSGETAGPVVAVPSAEAALPPALPPAEAPAPGAEMAAAETASPLPPAPADEADTAPSPSAPERLSVGRYISEEQVLAQLDNESGSWFRLATDAPLSRGQQLLALPTYRPQILLAPNLKITFAGEAGATAFEPFSSELATLQIDYGRALVVSADSNPAQVHLALADLEGVAGLSDPDSILAVEVVPFVPDGLDPVATPHRAAVRLVAVSGQVSWAEGTAEQTITAGESLVLGLDGSPRRDPAGPLPTWIEGTDASDIELRASRELRRHLALVRPLNLSLLERTEFRQEEVRALAARCLASLDVFDPTLKALDDPAQRSYWPAHFDALRKAVNRHSEAAERVLADLQKSYGDDGRALFRLLWGFTPEQLESGADRELVRHLEHPTMIGRVLAIENLRRITDKTMLFNAWLPPSQEKSKIIKWQKAAEEGSIRYPKTPPAPPKPAPAPTGGGSPAKPARAAS